jgi:alkanesulfonate monooxygenase SsuD/methylene tetrahydromethanopterin reductase-like flavin-dependent oxidoreductase (luciferase family)
MDLAVGLPTQEPTTTRESVLAWATLADRGGFSSLMARDRVETTLQEPLIALAIAAGATDRIRLLASTILPATRETTLLARQAASLDVLSGGRFTMGIGVGYRPEDYVATGYSFHERGRRVDEQLPLLRRIWAGERVIEGVAPIGPRPVTPGGPRLLIGGHVPPVARRVALYGEGYLASVGGDDTDLARMLKLWHLIETAWQDAGRTGRPTLVTAGYFGLGPGADSLADSYIAKNFAFKPELAERLRRGVPTTPAGIRAMIQRHEALGADELILLSLSEDIRALEALIEVAGPTPART